MKCLIIKVAHQKYALSIEQIIHIVEPVKLETLPNMPSYILGALNFHGELIMAVDLAGLLNIKGSHYDPMRSAMVICQLGETKFALIFDEVESVEEFEGNVACIMGDQVLLLELDKLVDRESLHV